MILSKLLPLLVLLIVLAFAAFVGYAIYTIATDIADKTSKKMEKKNVSFGKEGMKIGVREIKTENYVDQTQRYESPGCSGEVLVRDVMTWWSRHATIYASRTSLPDFVHLSSAALVRLPYQSLTSFYSYSLLVKAWNYSSWPAYKSRFWNKENEQPQSRIP
ncbi:hypothetical protein MMC28_001069 [Mycoblastus sanguinarius]|nr:hypothetical protein [Mycoblastus sanguinarius]